MNNSEKNLINYKSLLMVFIALFIGQLAFLLVCYFITSNNGSYASSDSRDLFSLITPLVAGFAILVAFYITLFRLKLAQNLTDVSEKFKHFTANSIVAWAFLEGANLLSIISYMLSAKDMYLYLSMGMLAIFLFMIPTKPRIIQALNLNEEEQKMLI